MISGARLTVAAAAAAAVGVAGRVLRPGRSARRGDEPRDEDVLTPPPPVTTQSSPGQIADLQQAYGAAMAATPAPTSGEPGADD